MIKAIRELNYNVGGWRVHTLQRKNSESVYLAFSDESKMFLVDFYAKDVEKDI